jgi:chromate transporter
MSAVILSVALSMAQKQISDYKQIILCVLSGICLLTVHSFLATLSVIVTSATAGYFLYKKPGAESSGLSMKFPVNTLKKIMPAAIVLLLTILLIVLAIRHFGFYEQEWYKINSTIFLTFSGMSLTLFGGGYVIVPAMESVIVGGFHWLTTKEFADAIAMGQITPGPVIITATFIGYRVAGLLGAVTATSAIFFPPGFLMLILSGFLKKIKDSTVLTAIFKGMRPAIIGMIFSATYTVGKGAEMAWPSAVIFLLVLVLIVKFKVNVVYTIPFAGVAGILLF